MTLKQKTLKFNGNKIHFAQIGPSGAWMIPAKLLGLALGYAGGGQKLIDHLSAWKLNKDSSKPGFELYIISGELLALLKKETPEFGVPSSASSATFLTIQGVTKVLLRSRAKLATEFRSFLVKNAGDMLPAGLKEALGEGMGAEKAPEQTKLALPASDRQTALQDLLTLLERGRDGKVFTHKEVKGVFDALRKNAVDRVEELAEKAHKIALKALEGPVTTPVVAVTRGDATQLVPVTNIQASSMTPNFSSIKSFFLTGHQKHPDFQDWLSAEEIGQKCGKTADQLKTFSSNYARNNGRELANVQAKAAIVQNGGYFEGIASLVDFRHLPIFVDSVIGCMTTWYLTEDGMLLWRNYWSPEAVEKILKLVEATPTKRAPAVEAPTLPLPKVEDKVIESDASKGWTQFDKEQAKLEAAKNGKDTNAS